MSIRNQNWYNLQSTRSYPLDEGSTCVDDAGAFVRNDIIVDCYIRFSGALGAQMYVQGITVSAGLVTVLFGVTGGQTVAVVSQPKPVTPYINYAVTALVPGVSGWIVFGPGIVENFSGRYTTVAQTAIQPRCARPYRELPIPTIGKLGLTTALDGVVSLTASTPVTATYETITVGETAQRAIVLRLDNKQISTTYNPLTEFLGPCGQRPESGTCPKTPIETINGIEPDCAGNINIDFTGFTAKNFTTCGGLDILTNIGLADVCAANAPKKPQDFSDDCCNPNSPVFDGITEYCWPDPTKAVDLIVDQTTFNPDYNCLLLPLCLDFSSCDPSPYFEIRNGAFVSTKTSAPPLCACDCLELYPDYGWIAIEADYGFNQWGQIHLLDRLTYHKNHIADTLHTQIIPPPKFVGPVSNGQQKYRLRFQNQNGTQSSPWFYSNVLRQIPSTAPTAVTGNPLCGYSAISGFNTCEIPNSVVGFTKDLEIYWGDIGAVADESLLSNHYTYVTAGTGTKNIAVLRNCPTDWAVEKTVSAQLKIGTNGVERNGGLLLGYKQAPVNGVSVVTYFVVLIDASRSKLRVLRYNNNTFIEETSTTVKFKVKNWYTVTVTTAYNVLNHNQLNLTFNVTDILTNTTVVSGSTPISAADYIDGFYGLFANRSYTFFNKFKVS
jgi:hypothetical protein